MRSACCSKQPTWRCRWEESRAAKGSDQGDFDKCYFLLVQHGSGAASFARTLHLEAEDLTTCVIDLPLDDRACERTLAELGAATGYHEAHYDSNGIRREPRLSLLRELESEAILGALPLGPKDVLVVSGGGKGIAAECALMLARETGVRLALLGRSKPDEDAELASNLDRLVAKGLTFRYFTADVSDLSSVQKAVTLIEAELGPVSAILHGAGINQPRLLEELDETAFRRTWSAKVQGMRNLLSAVEARRLRLLIAFSSLIVRTGMRGEADYALANEWLSRLTAEFHSQHPDCRCLALEWSVWSGVGMGERLGRIDALLREGITPISPEAGVSILRQLLTQSLHTTSVVVTGRFGEPPTLKLDRPELPFLRFLEQPRVFYPGVELVVDFELSSASDPYLDDHVFNGDRLLPAVIGLEAMAQAAMAVLGTRERPRFERVEFARPVVVGEGKTLSLRIATLARSRGQVEAALRSAETDFQVDHFRAVCVFGQSEEKAYS